MNKQKVMKWALPALLMSAMTFEIMPGSISYFTNDGSAIPEGTWNFFSIPVEGMATSCLALTGALTLVAMLLALVAACFKKQNLYNMTGWCCLGAAAFAAAPYIAKPEGGVMMPNVIVLIILTVSWLLAMAMHKQAVQAEEKPSLERR